MSYRKIVSVVNEHTLSTVIARYAISLAAACKAELVLYAAHDERSDVPVLHETDRHLDHLMKIAVDLGISVVRITEIGNIGSMLPKRVVEEQADLVCYPLAPYKRYGADLQRHTVRQLLRTIKPDLAIIRAVTMAKPHPGHILVPLGNSISDSERRLTFISGLAGSFNAQVTLYHLSSRREIEKMPDDITRFRKKLQQQNITVLERKGVGPLGGAITVEAISHHNDLIIVGASERGAVRKIFFGNPAGDILQHPPCNTILFRSAH